MHRNSFLINAKRWKTCFFAKKSLKNLKCQRGASLFMNGGWGVVLSGLHYNSHESPYLCKRCPFIFPEDSEKIENPKFFTPFPLVAWLKNFATPIHGVAQIFDPETQKNILKMPKLAYKRLTN